MRAGVLIFAFNNQRTDYLAMAAWSADNIHRLLNLPVCIVTNVDKIPAEYNFDHVVRCDPHGGNRRMFGDYGDKMYADEWYNENRVDAYSLTPFDQTIVLDADYIVASDQLTTLLNVDEDFLSHRLAYDVTNRNEFNGHNYFGNRNMPMWWATVMMFKRSKTAELIFDSMQMIRKNWNHYRDLYGISALEYRNDHALSIALCLVNGHVLPIANIPWSLATLLPGPKLTQLEQDSYRIEYVTSLQHNRYLTLTNQDFHVLGKSQLGGMIANSK